MTLMIFPSKEFRNRQFELSNGIESKREMDSDAVVIVDGKEMINWGEMPPPPIDEKTIDGETLRCLLWGFGEFNVRSTLGKKDTEPHPTLRFHADRSRIISGLLTIWLIPRRHVLTFEEMLHYCHHFVPPGLPRMFKDLDKTLMAHRKNYPTTEIGRLIGIEACLQSEEFMRQLECGKYTRDYGLDLEKARGLVKQALIFSGQELKPLLDMIAALGSGGDDGFDTIQLPWTMTKCLMRLKLLFLKRVRKPGGMRANLGIGANAVDEELQRDIDDIGRNKLLAAKNLTERIDEPQK